MKYTYRQYTAVCEDQVFSVCMYVTYIHTYIHTSQTLTHEVYIQTIHCDMRRPSVQCSVALSPDSPLTLVHDSGDLIQNVEVVALVRIVCV